MNTTNAGGKQRAAHTKLGKIRTANYLADFCTHFAPCKCRERHFYVSQLKTQNDTTEGGSIELFSLVRRSTVRWLAPVVCATLRLLTTL